MKTLVAMLVALGLAAPFATPVLAEPTDQVSCEDEGMTWDDDMQVCQPAE